MKLTINTTSSLAIHGVSKVLNSDEEKEEKWQSFLKKQAHVFSSELGELKGSLMKAGQMLSMYGEYFLPREANEVLKTLQAQSPPLEWAVLKKSLEKYLTPEQMDQLDINPKAQASASIGQVHQAKIKATGEVVAIKVQYPDVDKAIDSDLKAIKTLLGILDVLPKNLNTGPLFAEIKDMLTQEMDYSLEAQKTQKFADLLKGDSRFVVPRVYPEFSNKKVIVSSWERGISPDDPLVGALSQERKNKLGEAFLDLYFKEIFVWGMVQTDPHLGNYKIRLNNSEDESLSDQLVLFDFGAVRNYEANFMEPYHRMVKSALVNDLPKLKQAARELNFLKEQDDPELTQLFENFCLQMVEPFISEDPYDWKSSQLPDKLSKIVFTMLKKFEVRTPPREILFLDRKTGGVFIFLKVLGSQINGKKILTPYMDKIKI